MAATAAAAAAAESSDCEFWAEQRFERLMEQCEEATEKKANLEREIETLRAELAHLKSAKADATEEQMEKNKLRILRVELQTECAELSKKKTMPRRRVATRTSILDARRGIAGLIC